MYTNGLKDRFGSPLISKRDGDKVYANKVVEQTVATHIEDNVAHISQEQHESLTELITNKDDYARQSVENTFQEVNNFEKHVNFGSSVETNGTVKVNSGGVILNADGYVSFNDDGLVTTPSGAKGYPYSEGIPTVLSNGGVYNLGMITEPIDISGVYFDGDETIIQTCEVWFEQGSTVNAITWMPDLYWIDTANGKAPTWIAKLRYRVAIRKEIDRLIGSLSYSYSI